MIGKYNYNKIYNEDSYKAIQSLPDNCIDLVVIDPPYDLKINKGKLGANASNITGAMHKLQTELAEKNLHVGVSNELLDEIVRVMKKINIYIW